MRYLSVCSGIEAASVAWHPLGFEAVAFAEIERFPCAVLKHHYPHVPNYGDLTRFKDWPDAAFDVLVGGTPCQSFSVAGLRAGLADPSGNLALTYLAVADRYRPRWLVWENVPGVLSVGDGRSLGAFLGGLSELGYGWAYRSLDAQYFRLAQRRRRVFVVGHLGDWRRAAAVLFERESLQGHSPPSRETWEDVAPTIAGSSNGGGANGPGRDVDSCESLIAHTAPTLGQRMRGQNYGKQPDNSDTNAGPMLVPIDLRQASRGERITNNRAHGSGGAPGHGVGEVGDPAFTVSERGQAIAFAHQTAGDHTTSLPLEIDKSPTLQITHPENRSNPQPGGPSPQLSATAHPPAIAFADIADPVAANQGRTYTREGAHNFRLSNVACTAMSVRRLTPRECERLQGFPDDYTLITYRGKPAADGPRYKALGNSMAVPVMAWIGQRIALVESL